MALADHDKSALQRQLLGDLAALIAVRKYLDGWTSEVDRGRQIDAEIMALIKELWP